MPISIFASYGINVWDIASSYPRLTTSSSYRYGYHS